MSKVILVVDDEVEIVKSVSVLLREKGREIISACDGVKAMELLHKTKVDCIVSDIYMPNMDGMMLIRKIREVSKTVPIIFFTGFGNEKLLQEALSFGAYDFIEKPNLDLLKNTVDECISKEPTSKEQGMLSDLDSLLKDGSS